jgi:hypothetical protein
LKELDVVSYRLGVDRDGKAISWFQNAILDPFSPMLEALSGESIPSAKERSPERSPDISRNGVMELGLVFRHPMAAWIGHGTIVAAFYP